MKHEIYLLVLLWMQRNDALTRLMQAQPSIEGVRTWTLDSCREVVIGEKEMKAARRIRRRIKQQPKVIRSMMTKNIIIYECTKF